MLSAIRRKYSSKEVMFSAVHGSLGKLQLFSILSALVFLKNLTISEDSVCHESKNEHTHTTDLQYINLIKRDLLLINLLKLKVRKSLFHFLHSVCVCVCVCVCVFDTFKLQKNE